MEGHRAYSAVIDQLVAVFLEQGDEAGYEACAAVSQSLSAREKARLFDLMQEDLARQRARIGSATEEIVPAQRKDEKTETRAAIHHPSNSDERLASNSEDFIRGTAAAGLAVVRLLLGRLGEQVGELAVALAVRFVVYSAWLALAGAVLGVVALILIAVPLVWIIVIILLIILFGEG